MYLWDMVASRRATRPTPLLSPFHRCRAPRGWGLVCLVGGGGCASRLPRVLVLLVLLVLVLLLVGCAAAPPIGRVYARLGLLDRNRRLGGGGGGGAVAVAVSVVEPLAYDADTAE